MADDKKLLMLFQARDERALKAAEQQYGQLCRTMAYRLLGDASVAGKKYLVPVQAVEPEVVTAEQQPAPEEQPAADEKRIDIAGMTELYSPVGIPEEACFLVRSDADYQAMTVLYPEIDCGFYVADNYDVLFLLIPMEDALLPGFRGAFPEKPRMNVTWDNANSYEDFSAFCKIYPVATYVKVVS